jgi:hypothetical protein
MLSKFATIIFLATFAVLVAGCAGTSSPTPLTSDQSTAEHLELEPSLIGTSTSEPDHPETTWLKRYGGSVDDNIFGLRPLEQGGFLVAGSTDVKYEPVMRGDMYLLQVDSAGEVIWEDIKRSEDSRMAESISLTDDGGYLVSGVTTSENGGQDIFLTQLDQDRQELWTKTYGGPLDEFGAAYRLETGGYLLAGNIVDPNDIVADPGAAGYGGFAGRSNIYLSRIDNEGNVVWTHTFGGENNVLALSGIQTDDSGFIVLATIMRYPDPEDDILLLKINKNGEEIWSRTWEEGNLNGNQIIETADGNYLIVGGYAPSGESNSINTDFLFIKVDQSGNELWQSLVGEPDMVDWAYGVVELPSGGYIAVGDIVGDLYVGDGDITLIRIDEAGKLVWQHMIEMNTHTMIWGILPHPEGGYVIAGSTLHGGNFDILLIRTDDEGRIEK